MLKKNWKYLLLGLIVIPFIMVYRQHDPARNDLFPKCPFLSMTGYQCLGCGAQRATHQLLQGNVVKAIQYNPLFVAALPYIFVGLLFEIPSVNKRFPRTQRFLFGYKAIYVVLVIIIAFWLYRIVVPMAMSFGQ